MRSEREILDLIINTAKGDERIRAVIISGSRANPSARRDIFQDFDITYLVTAVDPFREDETWAERFGEIMIMQMPEAMQDPPPKNDGHFTYMMQFTDGNRIDLTLFPIAKLPEFGRESLSVLLLDKDCAFEPFPAASESDYLPVPPTAGAFSDCCNEFWWVCTYVGKGLWREEIIYAKHMLDRIVRDQLMKMLDWYFAVQTQFSRSPGKLGKHLRQHLEPELWALLEKTYSDAGYDRTWEALLAMCKLFRKVATRVSTHFDFNYANKDDEGVTAHLKHIRSLPRDATEMYQPASLL